MIYNITNNHKLNKCFVASIAMTAMAIAVFLISENSINHSFSSFNLYGKVSFCTAIIGGAIVVCLIAGIIRSKLKKESDSLNSASKSFPGRPEDSTATLLEEEVGLEGDQVVRRTSRFVTCSSETAMASAKAMRDLVNVKNSEMLAQIIKMIPTGAETVIKFILKCDVIPGASTSPARNYKFATVYIKKTAENQAQTVFTVAHYAQGLLDTDLSKAMIVASGSQPRAASDGLYLCPIMRPDFYREDLMTEDIPRPFKDTSYGHAVDIIHTVMRMFKNGIPLSAQETIRNVQFTVHLKLPKLLFPDCISSISWMGDPVIGLSMGGDSDKETFQRQVDEAQGLVRPQEIPADAVVVRQLTVGAPAALTQFKGELDGPARPPRLAIDPPEG